MSPHPNSFSALDSLRAGNRSYAYFRLDALERAGIGKLSRLPFSLKILLENLLRCEDGRAVRRADIEALARYDGHRGQEREIAFTPARVLLQDFTGVPCVVDLAAMRDAMAEMGGDAGVINPLQPVELVIDHSVQVDYFANAGALAKNTALEFERNRERYAFLKWGQSALQDFRVVPPGTGIVHQVNIEYLARVVFGAAGASEEGVLAYPDTAVGTDSHTTMVNGLGVLAWGVGGIEAEAAMLGQPVTMLIPEVIGFRLDGALREGVTATDLVLTVAEMLRRKGVVGKFVEFYGKGLSALPVVDRTTISNMSPEFGSTVAIFPIDDRTLDYLRLTGPPARADRFGRSLRQSPRALSHRCIARSGVCRHTRARSRQRGAQPCRPEPPARPRRVARRQAFVSTCDGRMDDCARPCERCGGALRGRGRRRNGDDRADR